MVSAVEDMLEQELMPTASGSLKEPFGTKARMNYDYHGTVACTIISRPPTSVPTCPHVSIHTSCPIPFVMRGLVPKLRVSVHIFYYLVRRNLQITIVYRIRLILKDNIDPICLSSQSCKHSDLLPSKVNHFP
jgi:hypothetical protein